MEVQQVDIEDTVSLLLRILRTTTELQSVPSLVVVQPFSRLSRENFAKQKLRAISNSLVTRFRMEFFLRNETSVAIFHGTFYDFTST